VSGLVGGFPRQIEQLREVLAPRQDEGVVTREEYLVAAWDDGVDAPGDGDDAELVVVVLLRQLQKLESSKG